VQIGSAIYVEPTRRLPSPGGSETVAFRPRAAALRRRPGGFEGVGEEPNAADYQIATAVRVFLAYDDLRHAAAGRPAADLAARLLPSYPEPIPSALPAQWLAPLSR
jgi:hypothetical protein